MKPPHKVVPAGHFMFGRRHLLHKKKQYLGAHTKLIPWAKLSAKAKKERMNWLYVKFTDSTERLYNRYNRLLYEEYTGQLMPEVR